MKRALIVLICLSLSGFAQSALDGIWEGAIQIQGIELGIGVEFVTVDGRLTATIDIPQQGAKDLELKNVSFEAPGVHFELDAGPGLAVFDGKLAEGEITGDFTQGPAKGGFYLKPLVEEELPYTEEEVRIESTEDVTLAGTLTIPEGEGPFPSVILATGSGSQVRDEDIFGFKIFAIIADHLTRNGIVVLRCDDRGFGESTGEGGFAENTSKDFAKDALAQVAYLKTRPEVDTATIGILGHSEGALIAGMVAADNPDIEFVVLMAGSAVPGEEVLEAQMAALLEAEGKSDKMIAEQRALQDRLLSYARTGENEEELRAELRKVTRKYMKKELSSKERKALGDLDEFIEKRVEAQLAVAQSPWYRFFLDYDPRDDLRKVDARVLAFFGAKDVQVVAEQNAPALEKLFAETGKSNYLIKTCCKANHLFQSAETGSFSEYSTLPKEFTPCFLPVVTAWILARPIPEECEHGDGGHGVEGKSPGCPSNPNPDAGCGGCPHAAEHNN